MSDDDVKRILYVQTSGTESPERSATVFFLASAAAAMDVEVGIYFTQFGPTLLQRGIPETLRITRLGDYAPGTPVNLEVDMMGRYVVEYLRRRQAEDRIDPAVTREHLVRHGFTGKEGSR